jgi:hypothetical protein
MQREPSPREYDRIAEIDALCRRFHDLRPGSRRTDLVRSTSYNRPAVRTTIYGGGLIVIGVVSTVIVSWAIAAWASSPAMGAREIDLRKGPWPAAAPPGWPPASSAVIKAEAAGWRRLRFDGGTIFYVEVIETGWPFVAMRKEKWRGALGDYLFPSFGGYSQLDRMARTSKRLCASERWPASAAAARSWLCSRHRRVRDFRLDSPGHSEEDSTTDSKGQRPM